MLLIRSAIPGDASAIRDITLRAYGEYAHVMSPDAWPSLERAINNALAVSDGAERIVAESNGALVGSVFLFASHATAYGDLSPSSSEGCPELRLLAVPPEARGLGVGRALVQECIRRARAVGAPFLGLHTSESMRSAIALYTSLGFEREPQLDFREGNSELIEGYRLPLTRSSSEPDRA
jgi:GNAT superfamily N-acetyltransferase